MFYGSTNVTTSFTFELRRTPQTRGRKLWKKCTIHPENIVEHERENTEQITAKEIERERERDSFESRYRFTSFPHQPYNRIFTKRFLESIARFYQFFFFIDTEIKYFCPRKLMQNGFCAIGWLSVLATLNCKYRTSPNNCIAI